MLQEMQRLGGDDAHDDKGVEQRGEGREIGAE